MVHCREIWMGVVVFAKVQGLVKSESPRTNCFDKIIGKMFSRNYSNLSTCSNKGTYLHQWKVWCKKDEQSLNLFFIVMSVLKNESRFEYRPIRKHSFLRTDIQIKIYFWLFFSRFKPKVRTLKRKAYSNESFVK